MDKTKPIDPAEMRRQFDYDADTGLLRRKVSHRADLIGAVAGTHAKSKGKPANVSLRVNGRLFQAHRVIWAIVHGVDPGPELVIDHVNRNPYDNRLSNLRAVTQRQNMLNCVRQIDREMPTGVTKPSKGSRYHARIAVDGKVHSLGYFLTVKEAADAYAAGRAKYHGEFAPLPNQG